MRDYETLLEEQRGPYTVVVDKTWEDINPRDCFEAEDADEICRKIDNGTYDWFMLRVRVQFEGYEWPRSTWADAATSAQKKC